MKSQNKIKMLSLLAMLVLSTAIATPSAQAADTGLLSPASYATGATGNGASQPQQALVEDVTTGSVNDSLCALFRTSNPGGGGGVADSQIYYGFSLGVPAGATIDGIEVVVSGYRTGPGSLTNLAFKVRLSGDAGTSWTSYKTTSVLGTTDAEYTLGGAADLWGQSWTDASFSNATFGLEIQPDGPISTGEHWKLDSVRVKVYYTVAYEGLSHGYWKNHTEDWPATGFSPSQTLESVFDIPDSLGLDDVTLLEALDFPGGDTLAEKAQILLRNAVAALLNAAHPNLDYPLSPAQVIALVNAALASEDADTILALEAILDGYNNLGGDIDS